MTLNLGLGRSGGRGNKDLRGRSVRSVVVPRRGPRPCRRPTGKLFTTRCLGTESPEPLHPSPLRRRESRSGPSPRSSPVPGPSSQRTASLDPFGEVRGRPKSRPLQVWCGEPLDPRICVVLGSVFKLVCGSNALRGKVLGPRFLHRNPPRPSGSRSGAGDNFPRSGRRGGSVPSDSRGGPIIPRGLLVPDGTVLVSGPTPVPVRDGLRPPTGSAPATPGRDVYFTK